MFTFCRFCVSSVVMNWSGVSDDSLFTKCTISWDLLASPLSPLGFLSSTVPLPLLITSFFFCPHLRCLKITWERVQQLSHPQQQHHNGEPSRWSSLQFTWFSTWQALAWGTLSIYCWDSNSNAITWKFAENETSGPQPREVPKIRENWYYYYSINKCEGKSGVKEISYWPPSYSENNNNIRIQNRYLG